MISESSLGSVEIYAWVFDPAWGCFDVSGKIACEVTRGWRSRKGNRERKRGAEGGGGKRREYAQHETRHSKKA